MRAAGAVQGRWQLGVHASSRLSCAHCPPTLTGEAGLTDFIYKWACTSAGSGAALLASKLVEIQRLAISMAIRRLPVPRELRQFW